MKKYIVVGAGILGASTAYHLAKAGADVMLVDRFDQGQATEAAAGIVCPWISQRRNKAWYRLVKGGAKYYPTLIDQLEEDGEVNTGYRKVGAISLHTDEKKLEKMIDRALKRREDAPEIGEITRLSPSETKALFPPLSEAFSSVHISGAARVNGRALRNALMNAAEKNGAKVCKGDAVLVYEGQRITGIEMNGERYNADQVMLTTGAWSKELLEPLGYTYHLSSQRAQIIHLEIPDEDTSNWPVVMPPNNQYLLGFDGGRVVVGATHDDDVGFDYRVTAGGIHEILHKAIGVAPGLSESTLLETKVGFRPFTPGFLPIIGTVPEVEGLLIANGLGASGLTSGPYLGEQLAKLALGQAIELDLNDYHVTGALEKNEGGR
ncbi:NAD(P)/FAD-dependent oxidoreductase [Pseudalkalibacillus berkeleyi]|uniref:FAD-binding oxidoreductase n=1 Tax=Pseudalkalibacillus berkeleyi TaxID=1069813 RepID=A0ABS9H3I2_9BACL|nr:FAD-binding oxidoreductase [Pseudalkalibacillus berkeleyi]MCF6138423.1 FAD-binding oxidoreductase [Pseudalkalibacillus berkeleyi]